MKIQITLSDAEMNLLKRLLEKRLALAKVGFKAIDFDDKILIRVYESALQATKSAEAGE